MPCLDKGNPSITVAWEPDVPGIPIKTAGKVSDVVVGASTPIIIARAWEGSKLNTNGNTSARPEVPPKPGRIPTVRPNKVPPNRNNKWVISKSWKSEDINCSIEIKQKNSCYLNITAISVNYFTL